MPGRAEGAAEQHKNQEERERHDEEEPFCSALELLELAAPFDVIPGGQFDLPEDGGLGLVDEAADVTPANIEFDGDAAARVLARDLRRAFDQRNIGELRERDARAVR